MSQTVELPTDIRLMNGIAGLLYAFAAVALAAAGGAALARLPQFSIGQLRIDGDVQRNSVATLRANALPRLAGSFFTLDLGAAKRAFETAPWVRRAVVRRVWPNRLEVRLEEHQAAALWGDERLVNAHGEVFDANLGDIDDDALPKLAGPDGSAARMLAMHARLEPALEPLRSRIALLALSQRGSWRAELESGAQIELGRAESDDELVARAERFVRSLPQLAGSYGERALLHADLRHRDGYAVRLRGVTTHDAANAAAGKR